MKKFLSAFFLLKLVLICMAQDGHDSITVTDMLQIKRVGSVGLSADASQVVYTVQSITPDDDKRLDYSFNTQLWLAGTDGSTAPRQLTFAKEGASQPAFSPDGSAILFVRSVDRKSQLFLLSLSGGEPVQLTDHPYGASNPKWSADGNHILFTASLSLEELLKDSVLNPGSEVPRWNAEKPGFPGNEHLQKTDIKPNPDGSIAEIRAYLAKNEADNKAKVITKLNFQTETSASAAMRFSHVFIVEAKAGAQPKALTQGFDGYGSPEFAGKDRIIASLRSDGDIHPDRVQESTLYLINIANGETREWMARKGYSYSLAAVSPSGKMVAYQESEVGTPDVPKLYVRSMDEPHESALYIEFDRNKGAVQWSPDESHLYFTAQTNGGTVLCRADIHTGKVEELTEREAGIASFDIVNGHIAFAKNTVRMPSELFVANNVEAKDAKQLTTLNADWLKDKKLSLPEKHTFVNDEGMEVEYWVMKPVNYQEGKKYPLLLEIHGGPAAMWGPGESSMWHEFQYFAAQGYGIVYSNPRGSGGYGQDFLRANMDNWGKGPASDVLTALDKAIGQGWADTAKLVISGGSYAGYLVSWIIAHDQRFKAACSQRGVYDLKTFFGEGNAWRLVPNYFGGYPWEEKVYAALERESPINYVQNITTPYIIFHGELDLRTGVIQSEMLYKSLKVLERPVEYVRHPGASHEITRSGDNRQRIDQMLRTYEFFERWIR